MFVTKLKVIAAAVLVLGLLGGGAAWLGTRPTTAVAVPVLVRAAKVKPGQVAVGKPDKNGLVTMFRPVVTELAAGDPIRIALHWQTEKGPLQPGPDSLTVERDATLNTLTITITGPDGKAAKLKPKVPLIPGIAGQRFSPFYTQPTFVLTLTADGIQEFEGQGLKGPWADEQKAKLDARGVYTIQVSGNLVRVKGDPIPIETGTISVELGVAGIKTFAQAEEAARAALEKKGYKLNPGAYGPAENADGERVFRIGGPVAEPPAEAPADPNKLRIAVAGPRASKLYTVSVKPDGTVGTVKEETRHGCIARGTTVETADGLRPIEQIAIGDRVWGYDEIRKERVLTTVQVVQRLFAEKTYLFGGTLRASAQHPIYVRGEWKEAAVVAEGDTLLTADLREVRAGQPKVVYGEVEVFDLTVSGPHTFFAGGFLVHNKTLAWTPALTDPWLKLWPPAK
jgi:hypothetical protein